MWTLDDEIKISSAATLITVLREVKAAVAQGRLRQVDLSRRALGHLNVRDVIAEGPWPDYLEIYFENQDGHCYRLMVETYHGAGGEWNRVRRG